MAKRRGAGRQGRTSLTHLELRLCGAEHVCRDPEVKLRLPQRQPLVLQLEVALLEQHVPFG